MKEKILSIVPEAILEEKHGIWFVSVPRTSFHDLALRLRNDEDTSFDFLVCMTGMDWGETLGSSRVPLATLYISLAAR